MGRTQPTCQDELTCLIMHGEKGQPISKPVYRNRATKFHTSRAGLGTQDGEDEAHMSHLKFSADGNCQGIPTSVKNLRSKLAVIPE